MNLFDLEEYFSGENVTKLRQIFNYCYDVVIKSVVRIKYENIRRDNFAESLLNERVKEIVLSSDNSSTRSKKIVIAGR